MGKKDMERYSRKNLEHADFAELLSVLSVWEAIPLLRQLMIAAILAKQDEFLDEYPKKELAVIKKFENDVSMTGR